MRSILAVLAGLMVLTALSFAIEALTAPLLMRMFPEALPDEAALNRSIPVKLLMSGYTLLCIVAGGYAAAWAAPRSAVGHAAAMGIVQLLLMLAAFPQLQGKAPLWFWVSGMTLMVPAAWLGGLLRARHTAADEGSGRGSGE
jgi:hypothetical protein